MSFGRTFFMLQQEAFLIRSCLTTGLNALRKATSAEQGQFYTAFFQLSIGLERLMKVTLILDYLIDNNLQISSDANIKPYSHDLLGLFDAVKTVADKHNLSGLNVFDVNSIEYRILEYLADFAKGTRYANLDALAGKPSDIAPLARWQGIAQSILESDVPRQTRRRIEAQAAFMAHEIESIASVVQHDLNSRRLSLAEALALPLMQNQVARYAVWHVVCIVEPLKSIMVDLSDVASSLNHSVSPGTMEIPVMHEFFDFVWMNRPWVLRKKRWP